MKLMLIDLNNLIYRSSYIFPNLYHEDVYTGGIFGFIKIFCSTINRLGPDRIIICDDFPPYKKYAKGYKFDRVKDFDVMKKIEKTKEICLKFFNNLHIFYFKNKGYEADDIIADICERCSDNFDEIVIASNDSDLYQLLYLKNVILYSKSSVYTLRNFQREYPELKENRYAWMFYQALCGGHNGLPKIKGIGDMKARKIVQNGNIRDYFPIKKQLQTILKMIRLPYDEFALTENHIKILETIKNKNTFSSTFCANIYLKQYGIIIDNSMQKAFNHLKNK